MSKKVALSTGSAKEKKQKKQIDQEIINKLKQEENQEQGSSKRRRLRKACDINEDQKFITEEEEEENDDTEKLESQAEQRFSRFNIQDDDDLKREEQEKEKAKKTKKLKGNQQIDKFIKTNEEGKKDKKQKSQKNESKVQLTLEDMAKLRKEKKQKRKNSSDGFIVDDDVPVFKDNQDEDIFNARRLAAYQKYNGSDEAEEKLIERAKQLSLTASSKNNLQEYAFQLKQNMKSSKELIKSKTQYAFITDNKQIQKQVPKLTKSSKKTTKAQKQIKTGPLANLQIVLTGQFQPYSKDELIEYIQQLGGHCPKSLTKKCEILLQGCYVTDSFKRKIADSAVHTSKSVQAQKRGIKIVANQDLDDFFKEKTGTTLNEHFQRKYKINTLNNYMGAKSKEKIESILDSDDQHDIKGSKNGVDKQINAKEKEKISQQFKKMSDKPNQTKMNIESKPQDWSILWTQKYKPRSLDEIIGQNSQINQLTEWLREWEDIHFRGNKREVKETKGFMAAGSINSKAALLSGDPGLGKTTTARLLAIQFNYQIVEFNASDIRNKSGVNLLQNDNYGIDISRSLQKSLIIMDEVDGMSSGDRGGIASIITMIKESKVPIICICNDRSSQKIRSLAGHCYDIRFHKPNKLQIVKRIKAIIQIQGGTVAEKPLQRIVEVFQNDIRQILSYLELVFKTKSKDLNLQLLKSSGQHSKDSSVMINHADASRKLMNRLQFRSMSLRDRLDAFFVDSDLVPIMIHQNYLSSAPKKNKWSKQEFRSIVQSTQGFVLADLLDKNIRKEQQWGLMPSYGFMACVYTTEKVSQSLGFPQFPSWLGKFSSQRKNKRLIKQLKNAIAPVIIGSTRSVKYHYSVALFNEIFQLLKQDQIDKVLDMLETYNLSPMILNEHLLSLQFNPLKLNLMADIPSATKAKLTRMFNKRHEEAKLKKEKAPKAKNQHIKFDPVLEQVEHINQNSESEEENNQNQESKEIKQKEKPKTKSKTAASKKK